MMIRKLLAILGIAAIGFVSVAPAEVAAQDGGYYRQGIFGNDVAVTIDAQSAAFAGFAPADLAAFSIACTEDSGTASLDVAIQRSVNGGATWADIVAFTQLTASGSETKLYADVRAASAQMIGDVLRVDYDVTGTGQYTCDVTFAAEG